MHLFRRGLSSNILITPYIIVHALDHTGTLATRSRVLDQSILHVLVLLVGTRQGRSQSVTGGDPIIQAKDRHGIKWPASSRHDIIKTKV
jgi:hypothetical protein